MLDIAEWSGRAFEAESTVRVFAVASTPYVALRAEQSIVPFIIDELRLAALATAVFHPSGDLLVTDCDNLDLFVLFDFTVHPSA